MSKKKKAMLATLPVIALAVAAAGCQNGDTDNGASASPSSSTVSTASASPSSSGDAASKEQKTITFETISGYYEDGLKAVAEDYHKLHPETTVKIEFSSDNQAYRTSFQAKMAAGGEDAPDIVHLNLIGDTGANNIKKGWLVKLNDFVNQPNPYNNNASIVDGISNKAYVSWMYDEAGDVDMVPFDLVGTGFYYNKDIFNKLGLSEPTTWEELLADCQKLKDAGYIAMGMSWTQAASYEDWLRNTFIDWATRQYEPSLLVQPGDAIDTPEVDKLNANVKYSPDNPSFDQGAVFNTERKLLAWKNKVYDDQGPAEQKIWSTMKSLSQYYEPGYATMNDQDVYKLFISGKAAIYLNGSWQLGALIKDLQELGDKGFNFGVFKFPVFAQDDPNFPGQPRGTLAVGHQIAITNKKDPEQIKRAEDFVQYLFSPAVSQKVYDLTLKAGQFVQGPSLVTGVKLSDDMNAALNGFKVSGNIGPVPMLAVTQGNPAGDPNDSTEFKQLQLQFYLNKISLADFLKQKAAFVDKTMTKYIQDNKYDLDPTTNP